MEIRRLTAADLEAAWALDHEAFHSPESQREAFLAAHDPARMHGAFEEGRLLGLTHVHGLGQYFGGRSVPMGGVASVAVAPEHRGRGLAKALLRAALGAMRERGEAISTLFPATTRLYRSLGWEVAGASVVRQVAPAELAGLPRPGSGRVRRVERDRLEPLRECYARYAPEVNGFLDRSEAVWRRNRAALGERHRVFLAEDEAGRPQGYLVYHPMAGAHQELGGPFGLVVDDLLAGTRDAALALWRLLASWASQVDRVLYRAPPEDPLWLLLPEQRGRILGELRWMTRIVDAPAAVAARGFAPGLEGAVELELADAELPENAGAWRLVVEKGRGRLEAGAGGGVRLDAAGLAALYTGWASCALLERAGRLAGGSREERAALEAAFAGPTPWMLDAF